MAFEITSTNPLTLKKWTAKDIKQAEHLFFYYSRGMIGKEGGAAICYKFDELKGTKGDRIRIAMPGLADGVGQGDDGRLDNNEEALSINYDEVTVHERAHALDLGGNMTNKRAAYNSMGVGRRELQRWRPRKIDGDITRAIHGLANEAANIATVNQRTPSSGRVMYIGQTTGGTELADQGDDATLSAQTATNALFGTTVIERAARKAYTADPFIAPIMTDGGRPVYIMEISIWQAKALKADTSWLAAQREMVAFAGEKSPLFKKALGVWSFGDGYVVVHVNPRTPYRSATQYFWSSSDTVASGKYVASAALLGENAIGFAQGQAWRMFTYYGDAGGSAQAARHPRIGTDAIYGVACLQRKNSAGTALEDAGRIIVHTQVEVDS